jgi:hypothetical protein
VLVWRGRQVSLAASLVVLVAAEALSGCGGGAPVSAARFPAFSSRCYRHPPIVEPDLATVPIKIARPHPGDAFLTVAVCIGRRGPLTFLVDTELPTTVIDTKLANQLPGGGEIPNDGHCGAIDAGTWVSTMMIGPRKVDAGVVSVGKVRSLGGNLSGVIGADLLSRFGVIRIDYRRRTMTIGFEGIDLPASSKGSVRPKYLPRRLRTGTATVLPMRVDVHTVNSPAIGPVPGTTDLAGVTTSVPVTIDGAVHRFAIGTDTDVTALSAAVAIATPGLTSLGKPYQANGLLSCHAQGTPERLAAWNIGTASVGATTVAVTKSVPAVDGMIGSATLQQFSPVVLDYADGSLLLGPKASAQTQ